MIDRGWPPAPFHATPRGWAGPNLLAMILFEKYGAHQPLNRQRDRYAREGVDLSLSTLADQVGACTVALRPLHDLISAHVLAAQRLHADDTPVPVLAKGKTATGRAWVYVRDDRPFGGPDPPAALFRYSRDRSGDHPVEHLKTFAGILQADIYAGFNRLYAAGRSPGPIVGGACWAHSRRKFYELADIAVSERRRGKNAPPISPVALEAVKRVDLLFDIERGINGESANHRLAVRKELSAPVLAELKDWMQAERRKLSRHSPVAKAMDYMLRRWELFARFLDDGRICLTNNAAERALRGIALGRRSWLFAGSDRGGTRAAAMYTLIGTAKLNDVDPQAWLADVLGRIAETPQSRLDEHLPRNWVPEQSSIAPHRAGPREGGAGPRPALNRQHRPADKLSPKSPAVFGGCLPITHHHRKSEVRLAGSCRSSEAIACWMNGQCGTTAYQVCRPGRPSTPSSSWNPARSTGPARARPGSRPASPSRAAPRPGGDPLRRAAPGAHARAATAGMPPVRGNARRPEARSPLVKHYRI